MTEPWELTLADAAEAISAGNLSPIELTRSCLRRIDTVEPQVKAFSQVDAERAMSAASVLTEELVNGPPRSPLHGIPVAVKDVIDVAGLRTEGGSDVLRDAPVASVDAPAVRDLRAAGAVVIGKTITHEFAFGIESPPTRNPWDAKRIAGGSSGGSAAALAAGECLGALGTDSGGSIRIPSAFCGVTGLRPRRDVVSLEGVIPFSWTHDTCGPMAKSAADVAQLWAVLSATPAVAARPSDFAGLRVAVPDGESMLPDLDATVEQAVEAAVQVMVDHGAVRVATRFPRFQDWDEPRFALVQSELLAAHIAEGWYPERNDLYGVDLRSYLARAESIRGADLVLARRRLDELATLFREAASTADVVVLPTAVTVAPLAEAADRRLGADDGPGVSKLIARLIRSCAPISYCGLTAVSVPCGLSGGMPVGLQIVAGEEATALGVAMAFQAVTSHVRQPSVR